MAKATAFVFCMHISGAQSAVCSSYQNVVGSESFGGCLVDEVLYLCVVANRLDLVGCHVWVWLCTFDSRTQLELNIGGVMHTLIEDELPVVHSRAPTVTSIAKMLP
jgi:hypothetical protein